MEPLTIRVREKTKESLEEEAAEYDVSVSEYVRELIEKGREHDDLRDRLDEREDEHERRLDELRAEHEEEVADLRDRVDAREERIETLEEQLARRSQIEEKVDVLAERVEESQLTYAEKRQRMIDRASLAERLRWRVTGVPVDEYDDDIEG